MMYFFLTAILYALLYILQDSKVLPLIPQDEHYHDFADKSVYEGIPNFADVVSNLSFVLAGFMGLFYANTPSLYGLCFSLIAVGIGSAYYHLEPTTDRLFWDRLPMTFAFGFTLMLALEQPENYAILAVCVASVFDWRCRGDLLLYGLVQFGGIIICGFVAVYQNPDPDLRDAIILYVGAKFFERDDKVIYDWTDGLVSGHTLKHLAAAYGSWLALCAFL